MAFLHRFWTLFLIFSAMVYGLSAAPSVSPAPERSWLPKIIGGDPSIPGEFPYIVSIQIATREGSDFVPICGGAIVSPTVVLSAAHCTDSGSDSDSVYQIVAGDYSLSTQEGTEQARLVHTVVNHYLYEYDEFHLLHDLALFFLEEPLDFNQSVGPIRLPPAPTPLNHSGSGVVAGWGVTENGGVRSDILNKLRVPIHSDSVCEELYGTTFDASGMLCAGSLEGGEDTCAGDSGGPLTVMGEDGAHLVGLVSWGPGMEGCGAPSAPGVYTKVSTYLDWIEYVIQLCTPACPES